MLNDDIIDSFPIILIILVLSVTSSNTITVSFFFSHQNGVVSSSPLLIYFLSYFSVSSLLTSVTTHWDHWLHWKYTSGWSYYLCISCVFFSQHNGVISPSSLLIDIFCCFLLLPPHEWVLPLVGINDYIGSTLLSYHTRAIYHVFSSPRNMALYHHHCWWLLLYVIFLCFLPKWS